MKPWMVDVVAPFGNAKDDESYGLDIARAVGDVVWWISKRSNW